MLLEITHFRKINLGMIRGGIDRRPLKKVRTIPDVTICGNLYKLVIVYTHKHTDVTPNTATQHRYT